MKIFRCVKCGGALDFFPSACDCGYEIPVVNGIYQFTDDKPISVDGDGLKWLGYENVGVNYEPGYFYNKDGEVGIGNSDKLAEALGKGKVVLDLGAGLGGSSVSFARAGLRAIASDISQVMLETAVKRAQKHEVPKDTIVFTRMNGYKLELLDHSVDAVLAIDVLHQVDKPDLMMREILRVLKPDGYFLQYGGGKSLGFTEEQQAANQRYHQACKDIDTYYQNILMETGHHEPPFKSWEKADDCIKDNFVQFAALEDTGIHGAVNMEWSLKMGLHKIKTRASGSKQLIPDAIHNDAWVKTDAYARKIYGDDYEDIRKVYNHTGSIILYKRKT